MLFHFATLLEMENSKNVHKKQIKELKKQQKAEATKRKDIELKLEQAEKQNRQLKFACQESNQGVHRKHFWIRKPSKELDETFAIRFFLKLCG